MELTIVSLMAEKVVPTHRAIAAYLGRQAGIAVRFEEQVPWQERMQLLAAGTAQVGFVCGLPFARWADAATPPVELLAAPVMAAARYSGQPVYFSDVLVRAASPFHSFADLRGAAVGYNEPGSLSGYAVLLAHLAAIGEPGGFFGRAVESGAHSASLRMLLEGTIDAAAIDTTVFEAEAAARPELAALLRPVATLGPTPIPPVVVARDLPQTLKQQLRASLLAMGDEEAGQQILASGGVLRFVAVHDSDYDPVRRMDRAAATARLAAP